VVAGINYFLKIDVGDGKQVHARVYKDLSQNLSVHSVQTGKTASDPLQYF
jgi:cystatin-A/B